MAPRQEVSGLHQPELDEIFKGLHDKRRKIGTIDKSFHTQLARMID